MQAIFNAITSSHERYARKAGNDADDALQHTRIKLWEAFENGNLPADQEEKERFAMKVLRDHIKDIWRMRGRYNAKLGETLDKRSKSEREGIVVDSYEDRDDMVKTLNQVMMESECPRLLVDWSEGMITFTNNNPEYQRVRRELERLRGVFGE